MEKPKIRILDTQFGHSTSLGAGDLKLYSKRFDWYRGGEVIGDIIVISEDCFKYIDYIFEKVKIGLIIESPMSNPNIYQSISNPELYNKFDYILTFNKDLISLNPEKFIYYVFGGCWIYPEDRSIYQKSKNISIISSAKRSTVGHNLRHEAISNFRDKIEGVYGRGYQVVENKLEALKDFRYSIIIENDNCDGMFSEKLIDCFVTGTIPIYWGTKSIGDFFNKDGMLCFNDINELGSILERCTEENYLNKKSFIEENFIKAQQYTIPEDCMWDSFFHKFN